MPNNISHASMARYDWQIISDWIDPNTRVMDLGCGNGELLKHLQTTKDVSGYGVELNPDMIPQCIDNGINVIQTNLDQGKTQNRCLKKC